MRVVFNSAVRSGTSLHLGCVIHGPKNSWVRFARVEVDLEDLSWQDLDALGSFAAEATSRYLDREREIAEPEQEPLF